MAELYEVIEALARSAAHSPTWSENDATVVAEWIEDEKPAAPKNPVVKTGGKS